MIEEQGRVLGVESGAVWVETVRRSTCGSCQARAGCGQALLSKLGSGSKPGFVRVLSDSFHEVGDEVIIGIPKHAVVVGSMWVYLAPLGVLFLFALVAQALGFAEPAIIAASTIGLVAGLALVRWHARRHAADPHFQPRLLRTLTSNVAFPTGG
ncbi:SoxR reducing system RseC family protein [Halopseudomonas nanhaiensis]|uniref:SoxR reducing system RseC family protein n=1 Tax=Halopseudomonas nanhaiensis TaxID=2830842 RepID=UPI001CC1C0CE|nr:SoxR reducing system RseC family protein [Halopseudomonas nanhaiensis]UAW97717.1 SoxR reducing system RseC family protein [Halopseudomonas nanhaiensis]